MPLDLSDPAKLLASVGWEAAGPIAPFAGGWDNHLWRFATADGQGHAVRLYRSIPGRGPAVMQMLADNEAAVMAAAGSAGVPVPVIEARGVSDGAPFFVMQWAPGVPLASALERRPWLIRRLGMEFGRLQARLHGMSPAGVHTLGERGLVRIVPDERLRAAMLAESSAPVLCHLDYHPLNVLVADRRISGVLDFTNAAVADRRFDLAVTRTLLLVAPAPPSPLWPVLGLARRLLASAWERGYRAEAGDFPRAPVFEAAAISRYYVDAAGAVADGRGWATERDVTRLRVAYERALASALEERKAR